MTLGAPSSKNEGRKLPVRAAAVLKRAGPASAPRNDADGHTPPLDDWRDAEILPGSADPDDFIAHAHPLGTCALGTVVDGDLRVQSLENLFVVDASVIPRITSGPINAAVVAIAETWVQKMCIRDHSLTEQPDRRHKD
jgi:choline dehydrogenase-like flavoprotein